MHDVIKVLALAAYPDRMAATRFRVTRYLPHLEQYGIHVDVVPSLDDATAARLYARGNAGAKARGLVRGVARQIEAVGRAGGVVWVQREAVLAGPPIVEAVARVRRLPFVLDYDDALWIPQGGAVRRATRFTWKFDWTLRRAFHAIAGSQVLAQHARERGVPATVLPTTVERSVWTPGARPLDDGRPLVIGWVGTHTTAPQLSLAAPALRRLRAEGRNIRVVVIGAGSDFRLDGVHVELREWSLDRELDDFRSFDVGIVPMFRTPWHEGKCAFKQIQLMAVGVPMVSSLVGGARDFLVHDDNALIATTEDDWYVQLRRLLDDPVLRTRLAAAGRALIERRICIEEQSCALASILRSAHDARRTSHTS